ncbi:MAG: phosphotransferase [Deltaproteobacteria bacterium]|jgi:5-methylthioribose kinase|nr:phosphotransferase [Deltaproteobacteria bacterium]
MSLLRKEWMAREPDFPWLEAGDVAGLESVLGELGWLKPGERVRSAECAGEGNMNLTLRVITSERSFVLKQARPWVEKYPEIAAPWERSCVEQAFYARVAEFPAVADRMPHIFGQSESARIIVMEDFVDARDLTSLYKGDHLDDEELHILASYLRALHVATEDSPTPPLENREMRALNHEHIYVVPLDSENGLELDGYEPGLEDAARRLQADEEFRAAVASTGERYLADARHLVHGDYFPGSWLRTAGGIRIIDPEFAFFGDPELDVACATAHLALAGRPRADAERLIDVYASGTGAPVLDAARLARYAAIEVVRRLIGVAQLPIAATRGERAALLARARDAMLGARHEALWP